MVAANVNRPDVGYKSIKEIAIEHVLHKFISVLF